MICSANASPAEGPAHLAEVDLHVDGGLCDLEDVGDRHADERTVALARIAGRTQHDRAPLAVLSMRSLTRSPGFFAASAR